MMNHLIKLVIRARQKKLKKLYRMAIHGVKVVSKIEFSPDEHWESMKRDRLVNDMYSAGVNIKRQYRDLESVLVKRGLV